ncbi:MAG: hypothetical protein JWR60_4114 [Polaromonas sp.]|nr:hypothetical protein [Polaromonas sp.]
MKHNPAAFSASEFPAFADTQAEQCPPYSQSLPHYPQDAESDFVASVWRDSTTPASRQSGQLHPRLAPFLAFLATVFACMAAAATVASNDLPLMLGGF